MFDEDELSSDTLLLSRPFVLDDQIEVAIAEAESLDLPFDLSYIIDYNPYIFSIHDQGSNVGQWVYFKGHTVANLNGDQSEFPPGVALIIGEEFGRYVLGFEDETTGWIYLGWVLRDTFDILDLHYETSRWTH